MKRKTRVALLAAFVVASMVLATLLSYAFKTSFITKEAAVFREQQTDETIAVRLYANQPHVAYVNVADYNNLLRCNGALEVVERGEGAYSLANHGADEEGALTVDLSAYNISVHVDDSGVWLPIQTLATVCSCSRLGYASYNGEKVYVNDDAQMLPMEDRDSEFGNSVFTSKQRAADMITFDYAQLRLAFDVFYGRSWRAETGSSADAKQGGLETFLDSLGNTGATIKEGLMSKDVARYLLAGEMLNCVVNGATASGEFVAHARLGGTRITKRINKQLQTLLQNKSSELGTGVVASAEPGECVTGEGIRLRMS